MRKNIILTTIIVILIVLGTIFYFLQKGKSPLPAIQETETLPNTAETVMPTPQPTAPTLPTSTIQSSTPSPASSEENLE
jgi:hypothetical protein